VGAGEERTSNASQRFEQSASLLKLADFDHYVQAKMAERF
jgi:hypothetical protein